MKTMLSRAVPMFVLLLSLLACKMLGGSKSYENSSAGLTQMAKDLSAADKSDAEKMGEALALPDPSGFFTSTFGGDLGPKLAAEYETDKAKLKGVQAFFILNKIKGRTEVLVEQHTNADDENMNGLQEAAVRAMKTPTVIYTVNVVEPGKTIGASLWSFAFVDGKWRYLGKMKATKPNASPLDELSKKDLADALKGN